MKIIMIIFRVIAAPFFFVVALSAFVRNAFVITARFIAYGGETIAYQNEHEMKGIYEIYREIKNSDIEVKTRVVVLQNKELAVILKALNTYLLQIDVRKKEEFDRAMEAARYVQRVIKENESKEEVYSRDTISYERGKDLFKQQ